MLRAAGFSIKIIGTAHSASARAGVPPGAPRRVVIAMTSAALLLGACELQDRAIGEPSGSIDVDRVNAVAASPQPEGCNGWPLILDAAQIARRAEKEVEQRWYDRDPNSMPWLQILRESRPPKQGWEAALEVLEAIEQSGAFEMLAEAARCPRMVRPIGGAPSSKMDFIGEFIGDVGAIRGLVKASAARMRLAADRNEPGEVVAAFEQGLAASRAAASVPSAIGRLSALANQSLMLAELRMELREKNIDEPTCRALLQAMDRQAWTTSVTLVLEGERALALRAIDSLFTDDGAIIRERLEELQTWSMAPSETSPDALHVSRAETTAIINEHYDRLIAASKLSAAQRLAAGPALTEPPPLDSRHAFLESIRLPFGGVLSWEDLAIVERQHAGIALALEAFHARHGSHPASLDALAGELLPEVPDDPLSGGPFAYRLTPPESAVPYLLYSIGADGIDGSAALNAPPEERVDGDEWFNDLRGEPFEWVED